MNNIYAESTKVQEMDLNSFLLAVRGDLASLNSRVTSLVERIVSGQPLLPSENKDENPTGHREKMEHILNQLGELKDRIAALEMFL